MRRLAIMWAVVLTLAVGVAWIWYLVLRPPLEERAQDDYAAEARVVGFRKAWTRSNPEGVESIYVGPATSDPVKVASVPKTAIAPVIEKDLGPGFSLLIGEGRTAEYRKGVLCRVSVNREAFPDLSDGGESLLKALGLTGAERAAVRRGEKAIFKLTFSCRNSE